MSGINDKEYNLLSQLAYIELPLTPDEQKKLDKLDYTVGDMVDDLLTSNSLPKDKERCAMLTNEWKESLELIRNNPELCELKITGFTNQNVKDEVGTGPNTECKSGLSAYCFETKEKEAIIAYRGSETRDDIGREDWEDNFETGFADSTTQQDAALDFLNEMKEKYDYSSFTTTGHSKGGNDAQYVAVMSDDVDKCISFDAPGFCDNFIANNSLKVLKARDKIVSYEGNLDYVSSLLFPIAGKTIIIDTEDQSNFLYNHKPNIFLDEDGNFYNETDKSIICVAIRTYTTRVSTLMPDWAGLYLVDSVFNILDGQFSLYDAGGMLVGLLALPFFIKNAIVELSILGAYYLVKEGIEAVKQSLKNFQNQMIELANNFFEKLYEYGKTVSEFKDIVFESIDNFFEQLMKGYEEFFNKKNVIVAEPYLSVNTARLIFYSEKLQSIKRQIADVNRRLENLYSKTDLFDIAHLVKADMLTEYNYKLSLCINYLNDSVQLLENTEDHLIRQANSI